MDGFRLRRWHVGVVVGVLALFATAGIAIAVAAGVTKVSGGSITQVRVARGANATTTNSTTYVNVPGASQKISVPNGQHALILARFSAESYCFGTSVAGNYCSVRIMIGGSEGAPATGFDFAFDTLGDANDWWESHSIDRSRVVGPGTWTVRVQYGVTDANTDFRLDDWSLTVERSRKS
jgi:hypothetical protein